MKVTACHSCEFNGKGNTCCITCKRANQDDIRIKKSPHLANNTFFSSLSFKMSRPDEYTTAAQHALDFVYQVTDLSLVEFFVALHMARGGRPETAAEELRNFINRVRRSSPQKRPNNRVENISSSSIWMRRKALEKRHPFISTLNKLILAREGLR